jgi:uncharacterized protein (TIGR00251 family)
VINSETTIAAWRDLTLTESADGVTLPIRAVPRASRDALDGVAEGALRVRLAAPPVEGAANKALVVFLAGVLGVPKRDIEIATGEHGRRKLVRVRGLTADVVRARLAVASRAD